MQCATTPHGTDSSQIECDIPKFNACIPTTSLCRQNVVSHVRDAVFTQRLYWIIAVREIFTYRSKCYFHLTWVASRAKLYFWWFIISLDMNAKLDIFLGAVYLLNIQYLQAFQWDDLTFNSIKQGRSQGGGHSGHSPYFDPETKNAPVFALIAQNIDICKIKIHSLLRPTLLPMWP